MTKRFRLVVLLGLVSLLALVLIGRWLNATKRGGQGPAEPFRIAGNLYYVGATDASAFLITGPEGPYRARWRLSQRPFALMLDQPQIRTATAADAEPLAALAARTFRDTFAADNSPDDMEAYVRDSFSLEQVQAELADDANTFLLAFVNGGEQPTGYAKLRAGTTDPSVTGQDPIELERLYVDRSALGHGVGAALMQASLDAARSAGHGTLWLGVWERNDRAIAFYVRWGFQTVGDHVFRLGSDAQRDLIMERPVPDVG